MSEVPSELKFLSSHEWVMVEGDVATIGVSDHAQELLGDLVYVELPEAGDTVAAGDSVGVIESVKAASDTYAPISGTIIEVNADLEDGPDPMQSSSTLIIPVENQSRELDAKLLLACAAAERGFPVILGSRAFVHYAVDSIPRGVYLAKSMRSLSERVFGILYDLEQDPPESNNVYREHPDIVQRLTKRLRAMGALTAG